MPTLTKHFKEFFPKGPPSTSPLSNPELISTFSKSVEETETRYPGVLRKFTQPSSFPIDLSSGIETYVPKHVGSPVIEEVLEHLDQRRFHYGSVDFVSFRNNFNKIVGTPYNNRDGWEVGIHCNAQGTVFFEIRDFKHGDVPIHFEYWGYNFEAICTETEEQQMDRAAATASKLGSGQGQSGGAPSCSAPAVNANNEFVAIVKRSIGHHKILLAAEIDCFDPSMPRRASGTSHHDLSTFVELKTNRILETEQHKRGFERHKLLKFWIQSYLAGVPRVCVGFRDEKGMLLDTEILPTDSIPSRANRAWNYSSGLHFATSLLSWVKENVSPLSYHTLQYHPSSKTVTLTPIEAPMSTGKGFSRQLIARTTFVDLPLSVEENETCKEKEKEEVVSGSVLGKRKPESQEVEGTKPHIPEKP